jgi:hypothetical protein
MHDACVSLPLHLLYFVSFVLDTAGLPMTIAFEEHIWRESMVVTYWHGKIPTKYCKYPLL